MTKRQPVGKCITIGTTLAQQSDVTRKTLWPCKDMESGYEHYGSCQVGFGKRYFDAKYTQFAPCSGVVCILYNFYLGVEVGHHSSA